MWFRLRNLWWLNAPTAAGTALALARYLGGPAPACKRVVANRRYGGAGPQSNSLFSAATAPAIDSWCRPSIRRRRGACRPAGTRRSSPGFEKRSNGFDLVAHAAGRKVTFGKQPLGSGRPSDARRSKTRWCFRPPDLRSETFICRCSEPPRRGGSFACLRDRRNRWASRSGPPGGFCRSLE